MEGCCWSEELPVPQAESAGPIHADGVLSVGEGLHHDPSSLPSQWLWPGLVLDIHSLPNSQWGEGLVWPLVQFGQVLHFQPRHSHLPGIPLGSPRSVVGKWWQWTLGPGLEHYLCLAFVWAPRRGVWVL